MQLTSMKTLKDQHEDWVESLKLYLVVINLDLDLREEKLMINENLTLAQKAYYEKWTYSNRLYLMVMKYTLEKAIRQSIFYYKMLRCS